MGRPPPRLAHYMCFTSPPQSNAPPAYVIDAYLLSPTRAARAEHKLSFDLPQHIVVPYGPVVMLAITPAMATPPPTVTTVPKPPQ